ncbi:hypothetical protein JW905_09865 [bacterium]|nr:hypothetical protein [candidate division CSSED10-310 bacterium]
MVAAPFNDDKIERRWTQTVEWLARFATSLPMPSECDVPALKHPLMAVRAALRVELALRAGDRSTGRSHSSGRRCGTV